MELRKLAKIERMLPEAGCWTVFKTRLLQVI